MSAEATSRRTMVIIALSAIAIIAIVAWIASAGSETAARMEKPATSHTRGLEEAAEAADNAAAGRGMNTSTPSGSTQEQP